VQAEILLRLVFLHEFFDRAVVRTLAFLGEKTSRDLASTAVVRNAFTALPPALTRVRAGACLAILLYRAFHLLSFRFFLYH
jgi:hypothetical protein